MLPAPDLRALDWLNWAVTLFVPIALGTIVTLLASLSGVEAAVHLRKARRLLATVLGASLGWILLAALLCFAFLTIHNLAVALAATVLASALASLTA
jgi:hypothetical protein